MLATLSFSFRSYEMVEAVPVISASSTHHLPKGVAMSDNTSTTPTAAALAHRFSSEQHEARVRNVGDTARSIVNTVNEPVAKVTEIALSVIMDFEEFSTDPASKGLKLAERIARAMEDTTNFFLLQEESIPGWKMELGLTRAQDAIFGASRVISDHSTLEQEVNKVNRGIGRRIALRREEQRRARQRSNHPKKQAARKQPADSKSTSNTTTKPNRNAGKPRSAKPAPEAKVAA